MEMLADALDNLRTEIVATVLVPGVRHQGAVRGHADVLVAARRAGREAIEMSD